MTRLFRTKTAQGIAAAGAMLLAATGAQAQTLAAKTVDFLAETQISGFVSAGYTYDFSKPADGVSNGLTWTQNHNAFTLNKFKLTLEKPVAASPDEWVAGYSVSLIFGRDSLFVNTFGNGTNGDIRQAYVALNVPIGNGLIVKAGQLISLLNFESGDGGVVNPNWSQGNQWFFTGNGPSTGVRLTYGWTDWLSTSAGIQNSMYGAGERNSAKTFMGNIVITPDDKTWIALVGFAGPEGLADDPGGNQDWLKGGQLMASRKLTESYNINVATELTFMHWDDASVSSAGDDAEAWSAGLWVWADINEWLGVAVRGDYVNDRDGAFTSGLPPPAAANLPVNGGQELYSATLTFNLHPAKNIVIKPEVRYDRTSLDGAFDGQDDRITVSVGAGYLF